jgi:hydrophobe/amphiphile efflux-3 (HAE3) family protein
MLQKIGTTIVKRPWLVIGLVVMITIGFGMALPSLDMSGSSMADFLPDSEVVNAQQRASEYFGTDYEMLMIYVEKQNAESVISPEALREEYFVSKELEKLKGAEGSISVASFVDMVCQMEFGDSLINCSDEQIQTAFENLMSESNSNETKMMNIDDSDEQIVYDPHPRISKGKPLGCADIKNYYLQEKEGIICFSIEVYDLSQFESELTPPHRKMNVMEWYIDFKNLITPYEELDMDFKIAAHIEPTNPLWEIGKGPLKNLKQIFTNARNQELFNSYKKEAYLWITPPGEEMSFPIALKTGNVTFNTRENRVEIEVDREELGRFGIAPKMGDFELSAKLGKTKAGIRYYQTPILKLPWERVVLNIGFLQKRAEKIQNRPILSRISSRMLSRFGDFSWEDFDTLFDMMSEDEFATETLALKDISGSWVITDEAPNEGYAETSFYIKPFFINELKTSVLTFLSDDYTPSSGAKATLMMIQINGSVSETELKKISRNLVLAIKEYNEKQDFVFMRAAGNGVISYQIDDLMEESNQIIMPGIFIVICLILLITFRRLSYMILPLAGLSISIVWLFGTMALLGMRFTTMSVAIVPLLMGLGVDYSVHMFHNYRAELEKGKTPGDAILASIQDVGMAMFLATLTTLIAFLSFLTATMPVFREFGVQCAVGIGYTFITTITLQAAARYLIDRKRKIVVKPNKRKLSFAYAMGKTSNIVCKHPGTILIAASLVTVVMIFGATNIETSFSMEGFLPEDNPAMEVFMDISENFPFSSQEHEYILIEGNVASVATLRGISETYENFYDDAFVAEKLDGTPKATSILSIIQEAFEENNTLISKFNIDKSGIPGTDPDVKRLYDYLYESDPYAMGVKEVLHKDGDLYDVTVIRVYTSVSYTDDDTEQSMKSMYEGLNDDMTSYGDATAILTGDSTIMVTITDSLTESQVLSTAISVILAAFVLIIAYRKPLLGLIAMLPVAISSVWIIGTMYFIGYSLNIMTVMITSLTIGLGITYAIHAVERFRLVADKTGDVLSAVSETVSHTGGALLIAAVTTIAGFGMLMFSPMPPEQQFGIIMCLTILYAFLTSIFILPPVVMKWGQRRKKKKGYIISPGPPKNRG